MIPWCGGLLGDFAGWVIGEDMEGFAAMAEQSICGVSPGPVCFLATRSLRLSSKSFLTHLEHQDISFIVCSRSAAGKGTMVRFAPSRRRVGPSLDGSST